MLVGISSETALGRPDFVASHLQMSANTTMLAVEHPRPRYQIHRNELLPPARESGTSEIYVRPFTVLSK